MNDAKRILILCAHSDDQVIGPGGTIVQLARKGAKVRTYICSFGEQSHPHLQEDEVRRIRVQESKDADRILGGSGVIFLGMREGKFWKEYQARGWRRKLLKHIADFKPDVILTHSVDDPHPDHRDVYRMATDLYEHGNLRCEMYMFDIWTIFNVKKRRLPRLVVDISTTFSRKLDALQVFRSQKVALFTLLWSVYTRAFTQGLKRGVRWGEVFYRVR
jgi:LmbE family N-acetylglucosaminyl deacetylase